MMENKYSPSVDGDFDYIILGAGCAGLSLLMRMIDSGKFADKKILLIDKEEKTKNDRTWCFWEKEKGLFEPIVFCEWEDLVFRTDSFSSLLDIQPYKYKMIRGIDFYSYCFKKIKQQSNIEIKYEEIKSVQQENGQINISLAGETINAGEAIVFNSLFRPGEKRNNKFYLLQHFRGWKIETEQEVFNPGVATLMDFRVHQDYGTSFVYVLPFNEKEALVEYTLFTDSLLKKEQYEIELKDYVNNFLHIDSFKVAAEEFGVIPMTNERFHFFKKGVYNIGTAGGQTKASTGYTFQFIQKQADAIVSCLINNRDFAPLKFYPKRFHFYDSTLLHLLANGELGGKEIFGRLFNKNKASQIFKFLDNETSPGEELKIMSTLQIGTFFKAGAKEFFK
ncbi:MAG: lycopene cyclase family protein [Sphingobacteriales bacterium]